MGWVRQVLEDYATACDLFNGAVEAFHESNIPKSVVFLRRGFFENLYVSPLLLGEDYHRQKIWYPSSESEPGAAQEYARRYGDRWKQDPSAIEFLREVWNDTLVRAELHSYINLSKNMLNASSEKQRTDLLQERELFINPKRLQRTQAEIVMRLQTEPHSIPASRPRLALILLASKDPAESLEFYKRLFCVEPTTANQIAGGYIEFQFEGVHLAIHGHRRVGEGDPYLLGPPPKSLGWGAIFVIQVGDLEFYYDNAVSMKCEIVDRDVDSPGHRFFVVRDPSGYVFEITEEAPRGLEF